MSEKNKLRTKEDDTMPTIELVEQERLSYLNEMEQYLKELKAMPKHEAEAKSKRNLIESGIIDENGELTEHYRNEESKR
jgi:hypothetical protein